jgi:hypothetical protein
LHHDLAQAELEKVEAFAARERLLVGRSSAMMRPEAIAKNNKASRNANECSNPH